MKNQDLVRKVEDEEILKSSHVSEEEKEIVKKLIALRNDKRIGYVIFGLYKSIENGEIHARVDLGEMHFRNLESFKGYLKEHSFDLPSRREGGIATNGVGYAYLKGRVFTEFKHFDES